MWLPLGAGGHSVKYNGRVYEAIAARTQRRPPRALFHAALEVTTGGARYVVESAPIPDGRGPAARGVVLEGPVGARWAGRLRLFRYELRCWRDGEIPDRAWAEPVVAVTDEPAVAARVVALAPQVPPHVWGRDPGGAGEMWNSNSIVAWLLQRAGVDAAAVPLPAGGRAPGWGAGLLEAGRGA